MPIQIAAHHVEVSDGLRTLIRDKAFHLLRIFDGIETMHVTLTAEKQRRTAEWVANVSHGSPIVGKVTAATVEAAVHEVSDKVEAQLRKHKDKVRDYRARLPRAEERSAAEAEEAEDMAADDLDEAEMLEAPEGDDAAQEA